MKFAWRRVRRGATLVGAVLCLAIVSHHWLTGVPWLQSAYWTVITLSGVGYTQDTPESVGPARQLQTIVIILVGMLAVGYTLGMLFQLLIEGQLERAMGVRRMTRQIEQLKGHVIVCGFGRMGRNLSARLAHKKLPFVVVESHAETATEAMAMGYLTLEGDATDEEVLQNAGIECAKVTVIALSSDADNVFLTLTARNLNTDMRILARGEQASTEKKLRQAGANQVVMPAVIGAQRVADMIVKPHAADLMFRVADHASLSADLEELTIVEGNRLIGQSIRDADPRHHFQLLIVAIRRADGQLKLNPEADMQISTGDTLIVLGEIENIMEFRKEYGIPLIGDTIG
jgi:voltage-gated potassium channel